MQIQEFEYKRYEFLLLIRSGLGDQTGLHRRRPENEPSFSSPLAVSDRWNSADDVGSCLVSLL